jgi:hypothetical protein
MLNPGEIGGIAGAGFLAVAGSGVYLAVLARRRRAFRNTLRDPDPGARVAALDVISEQGVYPYLDVLTERALIESDPKVQASLARIISRAHWDPSSDRRLLQLKGWADRVAATSPEHSKEAPDDRPSPGPDVDLNPEPAAASPAAEPAHELKSGVPGGARQVGGLGEPHSGRHDPVEEWLVPDPWADKPIDSTANGSRPEPDLESVAAPEPRGAAKAERSAIELLQEAGYGVDRPQHAKAPAPPEQPVETHRPDLRQSLQEFLAQRVITVTILEEAVRRMRAENDRLESSFGSELD